MPYAQRDHTGKITAVFLEPQESAKEWVDIRDRALLEFLGTHEAGVLHQRLLEESDADAFRVVEDLIDLLIRKRLISFTELPPAAQSKMSARRHIREQIRESHAPLIENGDIL